MSACGGDGRTLRAPRPDQTQSITSIATTKATEATVAPVTPVTPAKTAKVTVATTAGTTIPGAISMRLPWLDGDQIPTVNACAPAGTDQSPAVSWDGIPAGSAELAIVFRDLDANNFVHWVIAGIDPASTGFAAGRVPVGAQQTKNGAGAAGYKGPCPPSGTHRYQLTLYALKTASGIKNGDEPLAAIGKLDAIRIGTVAQLGIYKKS